MPTIRRRTDCVTAMVEDELVMMSVDLGRYFGLNPTAGRVWELLEEPRTLDDLCDTLQQEYDVAPDTCRQELTALVEDLKQQGLVTFE